MPIRKFSVKSPDPDLGKSRSDNALAKLGHLNRLVTEINDALANTGSGGSGGGGLVETTATAVQTLIATNALVPGSLYKITGFNKDMINGSAGNPDGWLPEVLYNDGTNAGITIYAEALTTNTLSNIGYGEFYNPKYYDGNSYNNTDGTGLYGIWDGTNPDEGSVPSYAVDQVVFWGGYAWKNLTGNVGTATDTLKLNPEDWQKLPYSNTAYYEKVIDEIKIDWANKIIVGRTNVENQITVEFNADQYKWWMNLSNTNDDSNPIAVMGWGLYSKVTPEDISGQFYGISNVSVINSVCETVNFKGHFFGNVTMKDSYLVDNYFGNGVMFDNIDLEQYSDIQSNTLVLSYLSALTLIESSFYGNVLVNGYIGSNRLVRSYFNNNDFSTGYQYIAYNNLTVSSMQSNQGEDVSFVGNVLVENSSISYNNITSADFNYNKVEMNSTINYNTLNPGTSILYNSLLESSNIENNTLVGYSTLIKNVLTGQCSINYNYINDSYIRANVLSQYSQIYSNTLDPNEYGDPSQIELNNITAFSNISSNNMSYSYISANVISQGNILYHFMSESSSISGNNINGTGGSTFGIYSTTLVSSVIDGNTIKDSYINLSATGPLNYKSLTKINMIGAEVNTNIASATIIFGAYSKQITKNSSYQNKLSYINGSNVLTIVDINA